ncbi:hypothetical protein ACFC1B_18020, partial [Streptomyces xiamenensis]|uniref:hypothetical protein n=1 Tax=Streptomyces xiamenensis TaxID=408015 RepID=UPI0035DCBC6D
ASQDALTTTGISENANEVSATQGVAGGSPSETFIETPDMPGSATFAVLGLAVVFLRLRHMNQSKDGKA